MTERERALAWFRIALSQEESRRIRELDGREACDCELCRGSRAEVARRVRREVIE